MSGETPNGGPFDEVNELLRERLRRHLANMGVGSSAARETESQEQGYAGGGDELDTVPSADTDNSVGGLRRVRAAVARIGHMVVERLSTPVVAGPIPGLPFGGAVGPSVRTVVDNLGPRMQ